MNVSFMLPALLGAGAIGLLVYAALSVWDDKTVARDSLRPIDDYELGASVSTAAPTAPVGSPLERLVKPFFAGVMELGRRVTPVGYVDKVRAKFVVAGDSTPDSVDRFLAMKVAGVVCGIISFLAVFVFGVLPLAGMMRNIVGALLMAIFVMGPDVTLNRRVEDRQKTIQRSLPDVLDLLTISVEAGLGFEQALDRVIGAVPGPLSDEFARMLGETRAGAARADAMRAMDERCGVAELRSFVLAIIQADTFGVSIGRVLRAQAEEMRIKRRQLAQERAQKAPVKMLIPMVFCIFPALFVVVLGPAALNIMETMG